MQDCAKLESAWLIRLENGPTAHMVEFLARAKARPLHFPNSPFGLRQWEVAASRTLPLAKTGHPRNSTKVRSGTIFQPAFDGTLGGDMLFRKPVRWRGMTIGRELKGRRCSSGQSVS